MIKKNCVRCQEPIPKTVAHNEVYGNWCTDCNAKTGYHHTKQIKDTIIKTPLELELLKEVKLATKLQNEMVQMSDYDYNHLQKKVTEEVREGIIEKMGRETLEV
jgi:hypothetical protein